MAVDPTEYCFLVAPFAVLLDRLDFHTGSGELLNGLRVEDVPEPEVLSEDRLPCLTTLGVELENRVLGAGPMGEEVQEDEVTFTLQLHTSRRNGWVSKQSATNKKKAAMHWLARVMDAMELNESGTVDTLWAGTCARPFKVRVEDVAISELSISLFLEVIFYPRAMCRAERSDDWEASS